jgi:predicted nucleic acid-binding protein
MNDVLVDSNVLLDVLTEDARWLEWSSAVLASVSTTAALVINPVVFAEVSVAFARIEDVDEALSGTVFRREPLSYEAAFLAGKAFVRYRRRGGVRSSPLPDFFIGAHAATAGYRLLTRDPRRYRNQFPTLELVSPRTV